MVKYSKKSAKKISQKISRKHRPKTSAEKIGRKKGNRRKRNDLGMTGKDCEEGGPKGTRDKKGNATAAFDEIHTKVL